jgi:hypothetical protein
VGSGLSQPVALLLLSVVQWRCMAEFKDIRGQKFGDWTVLERADNSVYISAAGRRATNVRWLCRCKCGVERPVLGYLLRAGGSLGCGCVNAANFVARNRRPNAPFNQVLAAYRRNANKCHRTFNLSSELAKKLFEGVCHYCESPPSNLYSSRLGTYTYNGIDRVDSSIGYEPENCVSCCADCNYMKSDSTRSEFIERCFRIARIHAASR